MSGHEWLDHLVDHKDPWLADCEPEPGYNRATIRVLAVNVLNGAMTLDEAHESLESTVKG